MRVLTIVDEDFTNYKKPCMLIGTISCNGKCCVEAGLPLSVCHNDGWRNRAPITLSDVDICKRYLNNPITQAVCFGGLEPFEQTLEMMTLIDTLRYEFKCNDDVVIYTGYKENELQKEIRMLKEFGNIIIKFGRFFQNSESRFDETLGVKLVSANQYARRI